MFPTHNRKLKGHSLSTFHLQVYALLDQIEADRQADAAEMASHDTATASSRSSSGSASEMSSQEPIAQEPIELDPESGDAAVLQLADLDIDMMEGQEKPAVRRRRLPGAAQRTSSLKLRRRK